jgi:hypothetical protein
MIKRVLILTTVIILSSLKASAPGYKSLAIERPEPINIYTTLLMAMMQVESMGDTLAYNPVEEAYGLLQIRPIRVLDFNMRTGRHYVMGDCYRPEVSIEIFMYYASRLGPDYEIIARKWNGSGVKTTEYWERVKTVLARMNQGAPS